MADSESRQVGLVTPASAGREAGTRKQAPKAQRRKKGSAPRQRRDGAVIDEYA